MLEVEQGRDIKLFEAFVSFKEKGRKSSHAADVLAMRGIAWGLPAAVAEVLGLNELAGPHAARVQSAFQVFGIDCQMPPVIVARVDLRFLGMWPAGRLSNTSHNQEIRP